MERQKPSQRAGKKEFHTRVRVRTSIVLYESIFPALTHVPTASDAQGHDAFDAVRTKAAAINAAWKQTGERVLAGMQQALDVSFTQPTIDAYVCPWFGQSISVPLILNPSSDPGTMTDILTHELLHILLTDNNRFSLLTPNGGSLTAEWRTMFGAEYKWNTLVHIPVHALLKFIYLDVLKQPMRLYRDIERHAGKPEYRIAWEYVEHQDYREIIFALRHLYAKLDSANFHALATARPRYVQ